MGLDMYLSVERYVGGWKHGSAEEQHRFKKIKELVGLGDLNCERSPSLTVSVNVAYWRKANQIHNWFVQNCQGGKDECQRSYVERAKLQALVESCKEVLLNRTKAGELLAPKSGFFFGRTDIDEWYFEHIEDTVRQLEPLLNDESLKAGDFYYQSSW